MIAASENIFADTNILVTGHTGFKGAWLSLWLSSLGAHVTGVSMDVPTEPSHFEAGNLGALLQDYRVDIRDLASLKALVHELQPDFVFHLAAQPLVKHSYADPVETWQVNTLGTVNVLESLRGLNTPCVAVMITSDKSYENNEWVWGYRETDALGGGDPYSASKGAAELAIRSYVHSYFPLDGPVRIGVGRAGNVIGGGDWAADRIVPDCMRAWSKGETVRLRNPQATRPWQHVLEPLSGYLNLATALYFDKKLHGEPFNFGPAAEQNHSVGELVAVLASHWEQAVWEDVSEQYGGPHEFGLLKLNCDKALYHLGWRATWDFETTVRETALWYRKYYEEPQASASIRDFSLQQIRTYTANARGQGLAWAL